MTAALASGAYTVGRSSTIDFEIDASTLTCDAEFLAAEFVGHLNDATRWYFANGSLIIELPADSGSLIFELSRLSDLAAASVVERSGDTHLRALRDVSSEGSEERMNLWKLNLKTNDYL